MFALHNFLQIIISIQTIMQSFLYRLSQISVAKIGKSLRALRESLGLTREILEDMGIISISSLRHIESGSSFCIFNLLKLIFGMILCLKSDKDVDKFCTHFTRLGASLFNIKLDEPKIRLLHNLVSKISESLKEEYQIYRNSRHKR